MLVYQRVIGGFTVFICFYGFISHIGCGFTPPGLETSRSQTWQLNIVTPSYEHRLAMKMFRCLKMSAPCFLPISADSIIPPFQGSSHHPSYKIKWLD